MLPTCLHFVVFGLKPFYLSPRSSRAMLSSVDHLSECVPESDCRFSLIEPACSK